MSHAPILTHAVVTPTAGTPAHWVLFLHGILGSGANWRTIARRLVGARPSWGAALVDLRMHGSSQSMPGPHTVEAAAHDLVALEKQLPGPIGGVIGHSFGGKVALAWAAANAERTGASRLVLVDSSPGMRVDARGSEGTLRVVEMLGQLPARFPSRQAFVAEVQSRGFDAAISQWLAMNLERVGDELRFGLDLQAIRALLDDYFTRDLWSVVENPPGRLRVVVVNGGTSNVYAREDTERVAALAAKPDARVELHVIPGAGHWVHADAPDALVKILEASFA